LLWLLLQLSAIVRPPLHAPSQQLLQDATAKILSMRCRFCRWSIGVCVCAGRLL